MTIAYRPTPNAPLLAEAISAYASGVVVPVWDAFSAWVLAGSALAESALSGAVETMGFAAACSDGASGAWLLQHTGYLAHLSSSGAVTLNAASGLAYTGVAVVSGNPYTIDSTGVISVLVSGSFLPVSGASPLGSSPARGLMASGSTLYSLLPAASGVGTVALTGTASGASGFIAGPSGMTPAVIAQGAPLAIGGWTQSAIGSGYNALAADPFVQVMAAVSTSGARVDIYASDNSGNWSETTSVTGLGAPAQCSWTPDGAQVLVADPTNGQIYILHYILGVLSLAQTLALSGAPQSVTAITSGAALVGRSGANLATTLLVSGGSWGAGTSFPLSGASAGVLTPSGVTLAATSGVAAFLYNGVSWTAGSSGALDFTPSSLATDGYGTVYAAATVGPSGKLAAISGAAASAEISWAGAASGVAWRQGQPLVADPAHNVVQVFSLIGSTFAIAATGAAPSGARAIAVSLGQDIFVSGTSQTYIEELIGPYTLQRQRSGLVAIYSGAAWITTSLGAQQQPMALAWNTSGSLDAVTLQNTHFVIAASGGISASGTLAQLTGQPQAVPLGTSSLLWLGGKLYASTALNDSLLELV